jgi:hypothetical protein
MGLLVLGWQHLRRLRKRFGAWRLWKDRRERVDNAFGGKLLDPNYVTAVVQRRDRGSSRQRREVVLYAASFGLRLGRAR